MHPLKEFREAVGLSQERLARELDVSHGQIARIEQGCYMGSAWRLTGQLAGWYGLTLDHARRIVTGTIENMELREILQRMKGESHGNKEILQPHRLR